MDAKPWIFVTVALEAVILLGQWVGQPMISSAQAQIPDTAAQRQQIVDQIKITNEKLDQLIDLLSSGNVTVKTAPTAEKTK